MSDLDRQLRKSVEAGDLPGVQAALAAGADVNFNQGLPLQLAAKEDAVEIMQCLLAAGADVHADADYALRWAAKKGHLRAVKCLLAAGADIHANKCVALTTAAGNGHTDVVASLLAAGADVHAWDDLALLRAAENGHLSTVQCLLWAGGNVPPEVDADFQVASCALGDPTQVSAATLARQGVCPEALYVLLKRQGLPGLAAMFAATRMLEPLTSYARAEVLSELLAEHRHGAAADQHAFVASS